MQVVKNYCLCLELSNIKFKIFALAKPLTKISLYKESVEPILFICKKVLTKPKQK